MRTVKIPIFTASLTFLLFLTGCKEFFADIEKDFSYWTSMVRIVDTVLGTVQIDNEGYPCIPAPASGSAGKDIILNLHNPRGYTFIMPNASGAPSDIIAFESGVTGSSGSGSPVYGTDYTMMQISPAEIKLSFTGNFLRYSQNGRQNLSPTISLYNTDGRKFDSYTFKLRCNNVPLIVPNDSDIKIGKTTGSDSCYVFCFKHRLATKIWQQDVNALCFKVDGTEYVRTFSVSSAGAVTPDPASTTGVYALVNRTGVVSLLSTDMPSGAGSPDTLPSISDSDIICLKTDVPVVSGGGVKKSFTLWLRDEKGLVSHTREKSTYVLKLSAPQIFAHSDIYSVPDSGIYTKSGTMDFVGNNDVNGGLSIADGSTEARAIPVYSAYGTDVKLIVKKDRLQNYPEGAVIKGRVSRVSGTIANPSFNEGIGGTSGTPAQISLPAPGETVYKSETWAEGAVFDTSDVRTLYYRVVKAVSSDTDSTVPVWGILKKAVEEKTAPDGTVIIDGEIKATNAAGNSGEIVIDKKLTIKKADGASSAVLNANKADTGKPKHRIFNVKANAHFDLDGLTLVGGQTSSGDSHGGAIFAEGATVNITGCTLKGNEARFGGAICATQYGSTGSTVTVTGGTIGGTTAADANKATGSDGQGGAIYVGAGCILTMQDNAQLTGNTATKSGGGVYSRGVFEMTGGEIKSNTAQYGGGIYVKDAGATLTMSGGTISENKAEKYSTDSGRGGDGGGVYIDGAKFTLKLGTTISDNTADKDGGGVTVFGGEFTMEGGVIQGNTVTGTSTVQNSGHAGGVKILAATMNMKGGEIKNNTAKNGGGGVSLALSGAHNSVLNMSGGTISGNTLTNPAGTGKGVEFFTGSTTHGSTTYYTIMKMSGSAKVDTNNDVYLNDSRMITVDGALTPAGGIAAVITPKNYSAGLRVLKAENGVSIGDVTNKFTVTPQTAPAKNWIIDKEGRLRDFAGIGKDVIAAFDGNMNTTTIKKYNEMIGHFIFYKTSSGNYGVMIITETPLYAADAYEMKFSYKTYDASGSVLKEGEETVTGTYSFDLDTGTTGNASLPGVDFFLHNSINIVPKNNARFFTQNPPQ